MNESQTTIVHDSYDDQQEIPRAFNHNEGNAIISGCIPDYKLELYTVTEVFMRYINRGAKRRG